MGNITEIREMKLHTGQVIKIEFANHLVRMYQDDKVILSMAQAEWEQLAK